MKEMVALPEVSAAFEALLQLLLQLLQQLLLLLLGQSLQCQV